MKRDSIQIIENPTGVDWETLHQLVIRTYAYMDDRIDPPSSLHRMSAADFERKASNETLILAVQDGDTVGCAFCRREQNWIYVGKVAVDGNMQGKGIGRKLFEQAFAIARRERFHGLELETRIELTENHRVFGKLGFVKTGESAHDGYDGPTSITMRAKV